jgi:predicted transcriptional regulator of viral defense system
MVDIVRRSNQTNRVFSRSTYNSAWFFAQHPVFTVADFSAAVPERGRIGNHTLLAHHLSAGHIVRVRRGLYAAVPPGTEAESAVVDPYLVTAKAAPDAIIAYHSALSFHGLAYSVRQVITYLTTLEDCKAFSFQGITYQAVQYPRALLKKQKETAFIDKPDYRGQYVSVTSQERTLVDTLDRIDLSGGPEEVWRSLATITYLKIEDVIAYVSLLGNSTTAAKVGLFLQQQQNHLLFADEKLAPLERLKPRAPTYMFRSKQKGKLISRWNLIVPEEIVQHQWEEVI